MGYLLVLCVGLLAGGLIAGSALMTGSFAARSIVVRMSPRAFKLVVDGLMLSSGLSLLWAAGR